MANEFDDDVDASEGDADTAKKSRNRSPNHPLLDLEDAVKRAAELHRAYGKHQFPVASAHKTWGYKEHGSVGNQCVAALKAYGLLDVEGKGKARKLALTDRADRIIRNAPDRGALLKKAAKEPLIHAELLEEYRDNGLPPDDLLRTYLVWEREGGRFNEDVVDGFIERFRATLGFASLDITEKHGHSAEEDTPNNGTGPDDSHGEIKVGSYVQWTSNGVDQFSKALPIKRIEEKGGERFAYFEASDRKGYAPVDQLTLAEPDQEFNLLTPNTTPPKADVQPHNGPEVRFPLSGGTNEVIIRLKKPVSKKDFERITQLLALSEDSLVLTETEES